MIIDATRDESRNAIQKDGLRLSDFERLMKIIDTRIMDWKILDETLLVVTVPDNGKEIVAKLTKSPEIIGPKIVAAISPDVNIHDLEQTIWGIFTRFDAERDIVFTQEKLVGISPIFRGKMGIDATWKTGYPLPLVMPDEIIDKVNKRWDTYWK